MKSIERWYFVRYRLYDINNVIHFLTFSQYQNWSSVIEENFGDFFTITEIIDYDV